MTFLFLCLQKKKTGSSDEEDNFNSEASGDDFGVEVAVPVREKSGRRAASKVRALIRNLWGIS